MMIPDWRKINPADTNLWTYTSKTGIGQARSNHSYRIVGNQICRSIIWSYVMKPMSSIFSVGVLALFLSAPVTATEHHTAQAMEHAGMAEAHGEDGHAKVLLKHAEESLKHAQASEKQHAEQHQHMSEAVKHLKEAIQHAKANHADVATKHIQEALVHMRQSTTLGQQHH
jgi:hypothetical protein